MGLPLKPDGLVSQLSPTLLKQRWGFFYVTLPLGSTGGALGGMPHPVSAVVGHSLWPVGEWSGEWSGRLLGNGWGDGSETVRRRLGSEGPQNGSNRERGWPRSPLPPPSGGLAGGRREFAPCKLFPQPSYRSPSSLATLTPTVPPIVFPTVFPPYRHAAEHPSPTVYKFS